MVEVVTDSNAEVSAKPLGLRWLMTSDRVSVTLKKMEESYYFARSPDSLSSKQVQTVGLDIFDVGDEPVMSITVLYRPYRTGRAEVRVCGELASVVRQEATFMTPVLSIRDARSQPVLRVKGPVPMACECEFELQTLDKRPIGSIRKKFGGLTKELFTKADQFIISFPEDLDVRYKAAVIGTCLLIDFLCYEKSG